MSQTTFFSHVRIFPGLNQYYIEDRVSCSRIQQRDFGESRINDPSSQANSNTGPLRFPEFYILSDININRKLGNSDDLGQMPHNARLI